MVLDHHQGHSKLIRSALSTLIYPLQYVVLLPVEITQSLSDTLVSRSMLRAEHERMQQEHLLISSKLQRYEILKAENRRLRELLESSSQLDDKFLIAELIDVEFDSFRRRIVINKGDDVDAYEGQPIVDAFGIMGQITHVAPFSSNVLLITDPNHALPVQVNRNGLHTIAIGSGKDDRLLLEHLPNNADIQVGDLIVSSGLGRSFPANYPVGRVEKITRDPSNTFTEVIIKPSAQLKRSREVLMVWPPHTLEEKR